MRISYSDDEDYPGQFELWQANCQRSLAGKKGQASLREYEQALLALPEKRLIHGSLVDDEGGVCGVACYARFKGVDLLKFDPEDASDEVGIEAGMPPLVAWKAVELNDIELDYRWNPQAGRREPISPEERYERTLAWVRRQIKQEA